MYPKSRNKGNKTGNGHAASPRRTASTRGGKSRTGPNREKAPAGARGSATLERPRGPIASATAYGSDVVADTLRALDIPYISLNPGASFRGLHDSLVNHLGNERPSMLLCLHEESAVAIAHGYAKVTGRAMAAAVHSNVGLMHATMAIFNAWCDRMPVLVIGATGPVDSVKRRPWIDWIHTARDQGALVRGYVKWDDQPASPAAAREALLRAFAMANAVPKAPVYVNLDAEMQESRLEAPLPAFDIARFGVAAAAELPAAARDRALALLRAARRPVFLIGRVSRDVGAWKARVDLAEALGARVLTDLKVGAAFPTDHPLHAGAPGIYAVPEALDVLREADVIVSFDWVDLGGVLKAAFGAKAPPTIIQFSPDAALHNGWSMDHQALPPVDVHGAVDADVAVAALVGALGTKRAAQARATKRSAAAQAPAKTAKARGREKPAMPLTVDALASALRVAAGTREISLTHLPLGWNGASWPFRHPLDFLGSDGGGGIGAGPGVSVGAALALRGSSRMAVGVVGDGDFLMGVTALWTAVHYRIPLLIVVANNRSFYNDEVHQERVARMRDRPVENRWIGQRMSDPEIDLAQLARAQGAQGFGPVTTATVLAAALAQAIAVVEGGGVAVVDVRVEPGYTPSMATSLTRGAS
jgi:thiamine pyrophosphate-dependent acetolactate synthase large subunit-like protein